MADRPSKRQRKEDGEEGDASPSSGSEAEEAPGTDTRRALTVAWLDPEKEAEFDGRLVDAADDGDGVSAPAALPPGVETAARPLFTHQLFDDERVEGYEGSNTVAIPVEQRERERERERESIFNASDAIDLVRFFKKNSTSTSTSPFPRPRSPFTHPRPAHDPGRLPPLPALPRLGSLVLQGSGKQRRARRPGGGRGGRDLHCLERAGARRAQRRRRARGVPEEARRGAAGPALGGARLCRGRGQGRSGRGKRRGGGGRGGGGSVLFFRSAPAPGDTPRERPFLLDLPRQALDGRPQAPGHPRPTLFPLDPVYRRRLADRRRGRRLGHAAGCRGRRQKGDRRDGDAVLDVRVSGPDPPARLPGERAAPLPEAGPGDGASGGGVQGGGREEVPGRDGEVSPFFPFFRFRVFFSSVLLSRFFRLTPKEKKLDPPRQKKIQFEDPTDEMQGMRERIEAKRAAALPWLCSLADKAAEAAKKGAAAAKKGAAAAACAAGKGKTAASASAAAASSSPSERHHATMLSPADAARARDELRISRQQVPLAFEALLALRLGLDSPEVKEAVRARLAASVAAAMSDAASKRVFDAPRPNPLAAAMAAAAAGGSAAGKSFSFSLPREAEGKKLRKSNGKNSPSLPFPFFLKIKTLETALSRSGILQRRGRRGRRLGLCDVPSDPRRGRARRGRGRRRSKRRPRGGRGRREERGRDRAGHRGEAGADGPRGRRAEGRFVS